MNTVELFHLAKRRGAKQAGTGGSFAVAPGEILGTSGVNPENKPGISPLADADLLGAR